MKIVARFGSVRSLWTACAALGVVLAFVATSALAADNATQTAVAEQDSEAGRILSEMANIIAEAPAMSVTIRSGYDAIQEDGQRIEFGEKRRIMLQRPDRVRVDVQRSDGDKGQILFDGKTITAFRAADNVFARVEKNGTIDEILVFMVKDLQMTMPLARMFLTNFPQALEKQVTSVSYVEEDQLFDVPTDHLAARSAAIDLQVWVTQGEQPLPRRVVITYKNAEGEPQFWAEFSDWTLSPKIEADSFSFTPPTGAEMIPLLAPVRQKGSLPAQEGDKQ